ncbi:hypothetical protein C1645_841952 [Glomus cerebriforme]|uniref:Uncharacterized protein n=1 Tax=Glomus cerebriforme TaxID=658196 RepID=A0A397RZ32_9GLOM|nr:hypothetical protein C1645_841952 [Glomus cerebriforme]
MVEQLFRRGEIYWQNLASPLIIILPITSLKKGDKIYSFEVETFINNQLGKVLVDQIITTDKAKRVGKFVGRLEEKILIKVERAIFYVLNISTEALVEELEARKKKIFNE